MNCMNKVLFGFCIGCLSLCSKGLAAQTPISQQKGESPVHMHMGGNNTPMENLQNQNIDFDIQLNNVWESVCRAVNSDKTENLLDENEQQEIMRLQPKIDAFCSSHIVVKNLKYMFCFHDKELLDDVMRFCGFYYPEQVRDLLQQNNKHSILEIKKKLLNFRFFKEKACALDSYLEEKQILDKEIEALGGNV